MRISDWSSDVCSSDLCKKRFISSSVTLDLPAPPVPVRPMTGVKNRDWGLGCFAATAAARPTPSLRSVGTRDSGEAEAQVVRRFSSRSEEHTSELQSLMRNTYAVFCLQQNKNQNDRKTK